MTRGRITKKLVALATTMLLFVAMLLPVTAAQPNTGTITVHKLAGATREHGRLNNTGERLSDAELAAVHANYEPIAGAEFTLYRLAQSDVDTLNALLVDGVGVARHSITVQENGAKVTFILNDGNEIDMVSTEVVGSALTDDDGLVQFGNGDLLDGYYVLVETKVPEVEGAVYQAVSPSLIRLPLTTGVGTHNYDVHVYPKNIDSEGFATKTVVDSVTMPNTDDTVTFELNAKFMSATVSEAGHLRSDDVPPLYGIAEIQDNFSDTFRYTPGSVTVHWLNSAGERAEAVPSGLFEITEEPTPDIAGGNLIVRLTEAGIDAAIEEGRHGFGLRLEAVYVGVPGIAGSVTNGMKALILAAGANETPPVEVVTYAPTINIDLTKVESNGTKMENVTFAVAQTAVPTINYEPGTTESDYSEEQLATFATEYIIDRETRLPITAETDEDGKILFSSLPHYDNDSGITYYLKEVATQDGFRLKMNTIAVPFTPAVEYTEWFQDGKWVANATIVEEVTVTNFRLEETDPDDAGFSLPLTGGAGTLLFTGVGIVVMLGAAIAYLHGKKRNV
jgi:Gram positive anchor.